MPYIREDQADIRLSYREGESGAWTPLFDSWKSAEGATLEASDAKTRPGGMGRQKALGGPGERDDCTASIQLTDVVLNKHKFLENRTGNLYIKVAYSFLGSDRLPVQGRSAHTIQGVMKSVKLPDVDSEASSAALYQLVVSCDEQAV